MKIYHYVHFDEDQVNLLINHRFTEASEDIFDRVANKTAEDDFCAGDLLAIIDDAKRPLLRHHRHSQEYRLLKIIEQVIETADDWDVTDSETTVYRRVGAIMNHLFRFTDIKLADGETESNCTKVMRQYNEIMYNSGSQNTMHGRKIDPLMKQKSNGEPDIELSSNEFKRHGVTSHCAIVQQCKNLRINGSILGQMEALNRNHSHTIAMDWVGNVGYMYILPALMTSTLPKTSVFYAFPSRFLIFLHSNSLCLRCYATKIL
ncbi:unnamed protein product [Rhizopus stolonifer]